MCQNKEKEQNVLEYVTQVLLYSMVQCEICDSVDVATSIANVTLKSPENFTYQRCVCYNDFELYISSFLSNIDRGQFLLTYIIDSLADLIYINYFNGIMSEEFHFYFNDIPQTPESAAELVLSAMNHDVHNEILKIYNVDLGIVNKISLARHEKEIAEGVISFLCTDDIEKNKLDEMCEWVLCEQDNKFDDENIRFIRKCLAGAKNSLLFVFNKEQPIPTLYGALKEKELNDIPFKIVILGTLKWETVIFNQRVFMSTFDGLKPCIDKTGHKLKRILIEEFDNKLSLDDMVKITDKIRNQNHGASIVFCDLSSENGNTSTLKERFENLNKNGKAIALEKLDFNEKNETVTNLARIDGAIVIDVASGKIVYLAAILDGLSKIKGDLSRGSRYNSIKNFTYDIAEKDIPIVSVVFSEDGGEDIIVGSKLKCQ